MQAIDPDGRLDRAYSIVTNEVSQAVDHLSPAAVS